MLNLSYIMKQLHNALPHVKCSSDEDGSKVTAALLLLKYYYYLNHTSFGQSKRQNWDEVNPTPLPIKYLPISA